MKLEVEITTINNRVNITGKIIDRDNLTNDDIKGILNGALSAATGIKNGSGQTIPPDNRNITILPDDTFDGSLNR